MTWWARLWARIRRRRPAPVGAETVVPDPLAEELEALDRDRRRRQLTEQLTAQRDRARAICATEGHDWGPTIQVIGAAPSYRYCMRCQHREDYP